MFKVTHYSGLIGFIFLAISTSVYSVTDVQNKNKSIYVGSSDARVNVKLTRKEDAAVEMLMNKSRDFKRINRKDQAAVIWERILKSDPRHQQALAELASYRYQVGDYQTAQKLVDALANVNSHHPAVGELNAMLREVRKGGYAAMSEEAYRNTVLRREKDLMSTAEEFDKQGQYVSASEQYRKVQWLNPSNPWASLGLARDLLRLGNKRGAEIEIEQVPFDAADGHYAYALFYAETAAWEKVLSHINSLTARDNNPAIELIKSRALLHVELNKAAKLATEGKKEAANKIVDGVVSILNVNHQLGTEFDAATCAVWDKLGEYDRSIAFLDKRQPLDEAMQVYWMSLLLVSKQDERVVRELDKLESDASLHFTAAQKSELEKDRIIVGIRKSDALIEDDHSYQAYAVLAALLTRFPTDNSLLEAMSRLDKSAVHFGLLESEQLLLDNKIKEADSLVSGLLIRYPENPRLLDKISRIRAYKASQIDSGIKKSKEFVLNYQIYEASQLISQLLILFPDEKLVINENARVQKLVAIEDGSKKSAAEIASAREKSLALANKSIEELTISGAKGLVDIDSQKYRSYVEVGYSQMRKIGTPGLNQLSERDIPIAWHIPLKLHSAEVLLKASNVYLDAGDVTPQIDRFGYGNAVRHGTYVPPAGVYPVTANGNSLSVAYKTSNFSADIGTSPAGFMLQNWVWGLRAEAEHNSNSLSIETTRRSVTDTVISFAGAMEPFGGAVWGGVAKTGVQAALYRPIVDKLAVYASYGEYDYTGTNVADNHSGDLNGSLIYQLRQTETNLVTVSLALSRAVFANNQNAYTWGNGGYYSPQQSLGIRIPFHLSGELARLSYAANLTLGRSKVAEDSAKTYPTDALWQANYGNSPTSVTTYPNSYDFDINLEYKIKRSLVAGGIFKIGKNDTTYQQNSGMIYLKFDLDKSNALMSSPLAPIKPFYQTTQGGVAHN